jgi:dynein heavy chain
VLETSITGVVFNYLRRGLFERDKLTISTLLTFQVMEKSDRLDRKQTSHIMLNLPSDDPGSIGPLGEWMGESVWARIKKLEDLKGPFENIGDQMQSDCDDWKDYFNLEKPEMAKMPGDYKTLSDWEKILILRALRPDRLSTALSTFITKEMGPDYVFQPPFDMSATYAESSASTPIFFVLFPGVDPTTWVETLGGKFNISTEKGNFCNISMGQGQEKPAEEKLVSFAKSGGWIMLQNLHLMSTWLPTLERTLEIVSETAHQDFRCFISAEPPPMPNWKNMPESLLQSCIKVANEAPSDLKSNLKRAWAQFSQETVDACTKPAEFKSCLFSLCWFHSVILGRKRFGQQGWSRAYSFNNGDLRICADVLSSYLDTNADVPWSDLKYIFGEIMYGGHITDAWDRRTNNDYLETYMKPELFEGLELGPGFKSPAHEAGLTFDQHFEYIENSLPVESPPLFGLHGNAEIGFMINSQNSLFEKIASLSGGADAGASGESGGGVRSTLEDVLERLPPLYDMITLAEEAAEPLKGSFSPYIVNAIQECGRMNVLLQYITDTLVELRKGMDGQLNMSDAMEDFSSALSLFQVPGRNPFHVTSWEKLAWPSQKSLLSWFADLIRRCDQLTEWTALFTSRPEEALPYSMWLSGLFNPTAFNTAVMQVTARKNNLPLDNMTIETHVTTMKKETEPAGYPEDGAYVHGLFMEGARWDVSDEDEPTTVGTTQVAGCIHDSRLKELLPPMPVMYLKAVTVQGTWEPSSVGYLRHDPTTYDCPVYITNFRGPTYVFLATLTTKVAAQKWTLAGVALVFQDNV